MFFIQNNGNNRNVLNTKKKPKQIHMLLIWSKPSPSPNLYFWINKKPSMHSTKHPPSPPSPPLQMHFFAAVSSLSTKENHDSRRQFVSHTSILLKDSSRELLALGGTGGGTLLGRPTVLVAAGEKKGMVRSTLSSPPRFSESLVSCIGKQEGVVRLNMYMHMYYMCTCIHACIRTNTYTQTPTTLQRVFGLLHRETGRCGQTEHVHAHVLHVHMYTCMYTYKHIHTNTHHPSASLWSPAQGNR